MKECAALQLMVQLKCERDARIGPAATVWSELFAKTRVGGITSTVEPDAAGGRGEGVFEDDTAISPRCTFFLLRRDFRPPCAQRPAHGSSLTRRISRTTPVRLFREQHPP